MNPLLQIVPKILTILTLLTDAFLILYAVSVLFSQMNKSIKNLRTQVVNAINPHARLIAFVLSLTSMMGSLFYSDILGYTPCLLCWYQRIAMYPIPFLLGMAIVKNDRNIASYVIMLSILGALLSAYHYYIQLGGSTVLPCSAIGYSVECSQRFSLEYGYVTIPVMAFSAFTAIIVLMRMLQGKQT